MGPFYPVGSPGQGLRGWPVPALFLVYVQFTTSLRHIRGGPDAPRPRPRPHTQTLALSLILSGDASTTVTLLTIPSVQKLKRKQNNLPRLRSKYQADPTPSC